MINKFCSVGWIRRATKLEINRSVRHIASGFVPTFEVGRTVKRAKNRDPPEILNVLDSIPHATPTEKLHLDHMTRLARDLNWERCTTHLFRAMDKGILTPNIFNVVFCTLVASEEVERAFGLLEVMKERGIEPDDITFQLLFSSLTKNSNLPKSFRRGLTMQLLDHSDHLQPETLRLGLRSLNNCGGSAELISKFHFDGLHEEALPELIRAYRKESRLDEAFRIAESVDSKSELILAETIRLHCSKNDFKTAQDLLGDLNALILKASSQTLNAYFHGCADQGAWSEMVELVVQVEDLRRERNLEPHLKYDEHVALIKGCARGEQLEIATACLEKLKRIELLRSKIDIDAFIHLLEAFLKDGYLEDFDEMFQEMLEFEVLLLDYDEGIFAMKDWNPSCIFGSLRYILHRWQREVAETNADFRSPGLVFDVGENGLSIFAQIESLNTKFMDPQLQLKMDQTQETLQISGESIDAWLNHNEFNEDQDFEEELLNLQ